MARWQAGKSVFLPVVLAPLLLSAMQIGGCKHGAVSQASNQARESERCEMHLRAAEGARLVTTVENPTVEISRNGASFLLDNLDSDDAHACTVELVGAGMGEMGIFSRYHQEPAAGARVEVLLPNRLRVSLAVGGRSETLLSVEPKVDAPADSSRWREGGLSCSVERGAYLRHQGGVAIVRSLGPDTEVKIENTEESARKVEFLMENVSERLSEPVLSGLGNPQVVRQGMLRLRVSGMLGPKKETRFSLKPRRLSFPFSFIVGGDSRERPDIFVRLVQQALLTSDPLFMVYVGDVTDNSFPAQLDHYRTQVEWLPFPIYYVKGNHEDQFQGPVHYQRLFGTERYSFQVGPLFFVILDSTRYKPDGFYLTDEQLTWADRVLAGCEQAPWKFVALHAPPHPLHGPASRPEFNTNLQAADSERLKAIARIHGVSYVLSGHAHIYARGEEDGVTYLTSGGAGAALNGYEPVPPGFVVRTEKHLVVLDVHAESIEEQVVYLPE